MSSSTGKSEAPKSVRFSETVDNLSAPRNKRRPSADHTSDGNDSSRRVKRPRIDRPNPDEDDDIDEWEPDEEDQDAGGLPDSKELMKAKRERRMKREGKSVGINDHDNAATHIDATTSLLAEIKGTEAEVPIEAFNMDAERTDGSGYFDGDTYVFRNRDPDEEPDAWLESLSENKEGFAAAQESSEEEDQTGVDSWSREDLYAKIIPLMGSGTETVLQALSRYGALLKRRKGTGGEGSSKEAEVAQRAAQIKLNSLTEAANALLLQGDVDIYQQTKADLTKVASPVLPTKASVQWEYRGNQDGQVHGPYTTQQMTGWIRSGYFIGPQAVQIRTVGGETSEATSTMDDLLSDIMDDDDDEEAKEPTWTEVKGDWMSSNDVNFTNFS